MALGTGRDKDEVGQCSADVLIFWSGVFQLWLDRSVWAVVEDGTTSQTAQSDPNADQAANPLTRLAPAPSDDVEMEDGNTAEVSTTAAIAPSGSDLSPAPCVAPV